LTTGGNFELLRASQSESALKDLIERKGPQKIIQFSDQSSKAKGWYSGILYAEFESYFGVATDTEGDFSTQYNTWFTAVRTIPNPDGLACTKARAEDIFCQKVLAKLKSASPPPAPPSLASLYDAVLNRPLTPIPDFYSLDVPSKSPGSLPSIPAG